MSFVSRYPAIGISIHALREEGDVIRPGVAPCSQISIHALREEGDGAVAAQVVPGLDFYPRPPRGGRLYAAAAQIYQAIFLSTPSARRATGVHALGGRHKANFYPRPPRGGRRHIWKAKEACDIISIHALREEGDRYEEVFPRCQ